MNPAGRRWSPLRIAGLILAFALLVCAALGALVTALIRDDRAGRPEETPQARQVDRNSLQERDRGPGN